MSALGGEGEVWWWCCWLMYRGGGVEDGERLGGVVGSVEESHTCMHACTHAFAPIGFALRAIRAQISDLRS